MVTRLRGLTAEVLIFITGRAKIFLQNCQSFICLWSGKAAKRARAWSCHVPLSRVEAKNAWSCSSTPPNYFIKRMEKFIFFPILYFASLYCNSCLHFAIWSLFIKNRYQVIRLTLIDFISSSKTEFLYTDSLYVKSLWSVNSLKKDKKKKNNAGNREKKKKWRNDVTEINKPKYMTETKHKKWETHKWERGKKK
jgi:hypothetical protein